MILFNDAALRRGEALDGDDFELEKRLSPIYRAILSKETHTPFSVMFSGGWGTGKTSAMQWMDDHLRKVGNGKDEQLRIDTCWFYPWKYQEREDVWKGLIAEVILATMDFEKVDSNKVIKAARQFGKFLGGGFVRLLSGVKGKVDAGDAEVEYDVKEGLTGIIEEYGKHITPQNAYYNAFEQSLKDWVQACYKKDESRLVIFVDDLDRCLPAVALQVLEAIKLYLNVPEVVVVVGVDRQVIDATVAKHYKEALGEGEKIEEKARQYLDKMFQIEVPIAPQDHRVKQYIKTQLDQMEIWQRLEDSHRTMFADAIEQIANINPRSVVRALNTAIVGAESRVTPLQIAQSIQRALISAVLQKASEPKFHDLCLRADGRYFFQQWTRAVLQNPLKSRTLPPDRLDQEPKLGDGDTSFEGSSVEEGEYESGEFGIDSEKRSKLQWEHLEAVATRFPVYRPIMQMNLFRNLLDLEFELEPDDDEQSREEFVRLIAVAGRVPDARVNHEYLASLDRLDLVGPSWNDELFEFVKELLSLRTLTIRRTQITDNGLIQLKDLKPLRALFLSEQRITDVGLEHIKNISWLTDLSLWGAMITDSGLACINHLKDLDQLILGETRVSDEGIAQLTALSKLTTLTLNKTRITEKSIFHLFSCSRRIQFLSLNGTNIGDEAIRYMKDLPLTWLDIADTNVTDEGLARLARPERFWSLDLSGTQITDSGLDYLRTARSLTRLGLGRTRITDSSIHLLSTMTSLNNLDLRGTALSTDRVAALRRMLPKCRMRYETDKYY